MARQPVDGSIERLREEIERLPQGSITRKKINGKDYYYLRTTENGKRKETYLSSEDAAFLRPLIARRKELEARLKAYSVRVTTGPPLWEKAYPFQSNVRTGPALRSYADGVRSYKKRFLFSSLHDFIYGPPQDKVLVLYGLRRTGKTTMIRQLLLEMSGEDLERAAVFQLTEDDTLAGVNRDLSILERHGFRYVFLDEVTMMEDFIDGAALFSDVYAASGMKIVLTGTDSLGFAFTEADQLYDRAIMLHTTFIPFREFSAVLGIRDVDAYIRYGGTMSMGGVNYNETATFASAGSTNAYVDTAIATNIQHALLHAREGHYFRHLYALYEAGELTNAINRIIQTMNHAFTVRVITDDFRARDLQSAAQLLRSARNPRERSTALDEMDRKKITAALMEILDVYNAESLRIGVTPVLVEEIREYLQMLDLIYTARIELMTKAQGAPMEYVIFTQPGMRFCQAQALIRVIMEQPQFYALSEREKRLITDKITEDVSGIMLQDIVLYETIRALPKSRRAFRLLFPNAEYDMVIYDEEEDCCEIYEIKHSKEMHPRQCRHLMNDALLAQTAQRFGSIRQRFVLYGGEDTDTDEGICYRNVAQYLEEL